MGHDTSTVDIRTNKFKFRKKRKKKKRKKRKDNTKWKNKDAKSWYYSKTCTGLKDWLVSFLTLGIKIIQILPSESYWPGTIKFSADRGPRIWRVIMKKSALTKNSYQWILLIEVWTLNLTNPNWEMPGRSICICCL